MVPPQLTKFLSIMYVDAAIILCQVILLNGVHCICSGLSVLPIGKISFVVSMMLCVCAMLQAYDQHLNMILGDVEETVTMVEIDEETYEEIYKVGLVVLLGPLKK